MIGIVGHKRWLALYVLCIGVLMIVLDTTIVNVALPSAAGSALLLRSGLHAQSPPQQQAAHGRACSPSGCRR